MLAESVRGSTNSVIHSAKDDPFRVGDQSNPFEADSGIS